MSSLHNRNVVVFGINADTVTMHRAFSDSEHLNFALLSDTDKKVIEAYGDLGVNGLPKRVTFIIGPDGLIHGIDGNVDAQFAVKNKERISLHGQNLVLLLSDWRANPAAVVPNFFLPDLDGKTISPLAPGSKAGVIVFVGATCPYTRAQIFAIQELAQNPIYKEVSFLGVDPNRKETIAQLRDFVREDRLAFPVATDLYGEVSDHFEVHRTPTVWVLDGNGSVVYRGAATGQIPGGRTVNYVKEALDAVLVGRPVPVTEVTGPGSPIQNVSR